MSIYKHGDAPLRFEGPNFPSSITKKPRVERDPTIDGYEADSENSGKSLPPASKREENQIWLKLKNDESREIRISNKIKRVEGVKTVLF